MHDHEDQNHKHKATWLELFYDLVFVIAIAELTHKLSTDISWSGFLTFVFLFVPVWWSWIGVTFYNDRFETGDLSQRFFTFLHMIAIGAIAYHIHLGLEEGATGFAISYIFGRTLITWLWARAGAHNKPIMPVVRRFVSGFSISILLWIISLWVPAPWKYVLWAVGLLIELITPLTTLQLQAKLKTLERSVHLPERFGLFMIIVIGETVVAVVRGLSEVSQFTITTTFIALLGATFAFMIWWLYFDFINPRPVRKGTTPVIAWAYGHFPLVMSIAALGAGILKLTSFSGTVLPINIVWLICGSLAIALLSIGLLENTLATYKHRLCSTGVGKLVRYGGMLACLLLPFFSILHTPWVLMTLLIMIVISQIVHSEKSQCHVHIENVINEFENDPSDFSN